MPKNETNINVKFNRIGFLMLTCFFPLASSAGDNLATNNLGQNNLIAILDGYAYLVTSDVMINLGQQSINFASDIENCLRPDNQPPLNNATLTLLTNNQNIGLDQFRYQIEERLLFLTSETSNLVCDNGVFVDQIFTNGFE